jgi:hypothetical protein
MARAPCDSDNRKHANRQSRRVDHPSTVMLVETCVAGAIVGLDPGGIMPERTLSFMRTRMMLRLA